MAWRVVGVREQRYRVDTPVAVAAFVADEIDTIAGGWVPLASERESDGCLRVLYGRLPPELSAASDDGTRRASDARSAEATILRTPFDLGWSVVVMLAVCAFLLSFALFARM